MRRCPWCDTPLPHVAHPEDTLFGIRTLGCPHMAWTDRMIVQPTTDRQPRALATHTAIEAMSDVEERWRRDGIKQAS